MRYIRPLVLLAIVSAGIYAMSVGIAGQDAAAGRAGIDVRELATSGFTIASVGDVILAFPESQNPDPGFQAVLKIIKDADVATANYEGNIIDGRTFRGSAPGGFAAVPEVAADQTARRILARPQKLSAPLGTTIAIEGRLGIIRPEAVSTSQQ